MRELAAGGPPAGLTGREATEALAIREALAAYRRETGQTVTALEAVTGYLDAARKLAGRSVAEVAVCTKGWRSRSGRGRVRAMSTLTIQLDDDAARMVREAAQIAD